MLLIALMTACDPPPDCERATELLEPCLDTAKKETRPQVPFAYTTTYDSGYGYYRSCQEGSVRECQAGCVVTAIETQGCEGVTDQFQNSDYLKCSVDCADAGSK